MKHRLTVRIVSSLSAVLGVLWVFCFPFNGPHLYSAFPANVRFLCVVDNMSEDWGEIADGPLFQQMLLDHELVDADAVSGIGSWLDKVGGKRIVAAYSPSFGPDADATWFFGSWLGGKSQFFRCALNLGLVKGVERVEDEGRYKIWHSKKVVDESGRRFSFAVVDGMLLACLSTDPGAVAYMLDIFHESMVIIEGVAATGSLRTTPCLADVQELWNETDTVKGFYRSYIASPGTCALPFFVSYSCRVVDGEAIDGMLRWAPVQSGPLSLADGLDLAFPRQLLGDKPDAMIVAPWNVVRPHIECARIRWIGEADALLTEHLVKNPYVLAAVLTGENSGRLRTLFGGNYSDQIKGTKVPTLLLAVQVKSVEESVAAMSDLLSNLNNVHGWKLIPHPLRVGHHTVVSIESAAESDYAQFKVDETVGYTVCGGWLIVSSNYGVLRGLLEGLLTPWDEVPVEAQWMAGLEESECAAYGWSDLAKTGDAFAVLPDILALQVRPTTAKKRDQREKLKAIKKRIQALSGAERLELEFVASGSVHEIRFRIGD